ncbi:transglutaminase family protein [Mucilaginibacter corticis]|uniref:Transglutaminase family protein n=1 Tax=Mucilaginibacter corticis TaxID=2597670 RepID=A0A556M981_9SPHI|nr:transglutaminase family protein [Mucilaginibacter corticis]TSJ36469.1 transglutaminase family protein [Mucilaginibacter corticis]
MKFFTTAELNYQVNGPGTLILNVHALRTSQQAVSSETLIIEPYHKLEEICAVNGENRLIRLKLTENGPLRISYQAIVDHTYTAKNPAELFETPVDQLPPEILPMLYPSRYCQSDKLGRLAGHLFGHLGSAYEKVVAIVDWIHTNVEYRSGFSNVETSAYDTVTQQAGVCRDFAHLGIALCRALSIPARYFTAYAYLLVPQDFHACFEAYLGGEWILFDATKLVPINGLIKIASGRDAADASIANIFGDIQFSSMAVRCDLDDSNFVPLYQ